MIAPSAPPPPPPSGASEAVVPVTMVLAAPEGHATFQRVNRHALALAALKGLALLLLIGGMAVLARTTPLGDAIEDVARGLAAMRDRPWAIVAFGGLYALAVAVGIPGTALTLLGGVAFGMWRGLAVNMVGALVGAAIAFVEGRFFGRDLAERLLGRRLAKLERLEEPRRAFIAFARLRLMPVVPFNATNFAAGITRAPLMPYLAGTAVGILPATVLFTYFAHQLVADGGATRSQASMQLGLGLGGLFLLSLLPTIIRFVRRRGSTTPPA